MECCVNTGHATHVSYPVGNDRDFGALHYFAPFRNKTTPIVLNKICISSQNDQFCA